MLIDLTDHTGTLHSCSLTGSVAEETLGSSLAMAQRDEGLSWRRVGTAEVRGRYCAIALNTVELF